MLTFLVTVRTESRQRHEFPQLGFTAAEVRESAAARFGYLCYVFVRPAA